MKANLKKRYTLPRWGMIALSSIVAVAVLGSTLSASAAPPPPRSDGRDAPTGGTQYFQDVSPSNTFFAYVNNLFLKGIASGYACGGPNEPCVAPGNLPYYRPGATVSRGQMSKFVDASQQVATNTIVSPFKVVTNAARGIGVWGGTGGIGPSRDIFNINSGLYGNGIGASNSIGMLAVSNNDNAGWFYTASNVAYALMTVRGGADIERGGGGPTDALYVGGHMTVTGGCTGCVASDIMMNMGTTDLHPGDVVALGALAPEGTIINDNAVAGVTLSSEAYDTGVVGVVELRYIPGDPNAPMGTAQRTGSRDDSTTVVRPGEYMTVITQGTYKMVKVDSGKDGIHVGDLLTTGTTAGAAVKVTDKVASIGAVVGKALGNLDSGVGYIPVLVTLK